MSEAFNTMFRESISHASGDSVNLTSANIPIYHFHLYDRLDRVKLNKTFLKEKFLPLVMSQFRYGEMLLKVRFAGFGAITSLSFASDMSDSCTWMTPLSHEMEDISFL